MMQTTDMTPEAAVLAAEAHAFAQQMLIDCRERVGVATDHWTVSVTARTAAWN